MPLVIIFAVSSVKRALWKTSIAQQVILSLNKVYYYYYYYYYYSMPSALDADIDRQRHFCQVLEHLLPELKFSVLF